MALRSPSALEAADLNAATTGALDLINLEGVPSLPDHSGRIPTRHLPSNCPPNGDQDINAALCDALELS